MTQLAIIADDLTGALDSAAPFAMRGLRTLVALAPTALPEALAGGAAVVGVSTDSREIVPDAAREAVRACLKQMPAGVRLFKKVDSRLKGNIATELDAIAYRRALVLPAIPAFGRWMRGGKLGGFGVPEPIDIAARLGAHAGRAAIPDATTQEELEAAVDGIEHDLPVGARALAEALARRMSPGAADTPHVRLPEGPALCVVGSTDPITIAQVDRLRAALPGTTYIAAPAGEAPERLPAPAGLTVLQATEGLAAADPAVVASRLAATVSRLAPAPGTVLLLTGGATAQAVLRELGIGVLDLLGEALPGLPIARAGGFTIITKSGGFGGQDTLLRLLGPGQTMRRESSGQSCRMV